MYRWCKVNAKTQISKEIYRHHQRVAFHNNYTILYKAKGKFANSVRCLKKLRKCTLLKFLNISERLAIRMDKQRQNSPKYSKSSQSEYDTWTRLINMNEKKQIEWKLSNYNPYDDFLALFKLFKDYIISRWKSEIMNAFISSEVEFIWLGITPSSFGVFDHIKLHISCQSRHARKKYNHRYYVKLIPA